MPNENESGNSLIQRESQCTKVITGLCEKTGDIAVMMTEIQTLKDGQRDLKTSIVNFQTDFSSFKSESLHERTNLTSALAAIQEALKAEREAKSNHAKNQSILLDQISAIQNDMKDINRDVKNIDHNVTEMQGNLKRIEGNVATHEKRLTGLERVSYWVYSLVGAIVLFVIILSNWSSIRDMMDVLTKTDSPSSSVQEKTETKPEVKDTRNYFIEDNKIYYYQTVNGKTEKVLYVPNTTK